MVAFLTYGKVSKVIERFYEIYRPGTVRIFETDTGVKCQIGRFKSDRFIEYVENEIKFEQGVNDLRDLVLATDLLRNRHTLCGMSLVDTPYYQLMEELGNNCLREDSEYIVRCRAGALDSRPPLKVKVAALQECYKKRVQQLAGGWIPFIYVRSVVWKGKRVYAIEDGKHRAALAAYLGCPDRLVLRILSRNILNEPFFSSVYGHVLGLDPSEYSINQEMIRAIQDG